MPLSSFRHPGRIFFFSTISTFGGRHWHTTLHNWWEIPSPGMIGYEIEFKSQRFVHRIVKMVGMSNWRCPLDTSIGQIVFTLVSTISWLEEINFAHRQDAQNCPEKMISKEFIGTLFTSVTTACLVIIFYLHRGPHLLHNSGRSN